MNNKPSSRPPDAEAARGGSLPDPFPRKALGRLTGSLKKEWKRYRKELKRCQAKFSEKAIHNSRVEARRLLSSAELLGGFIGPERLKKVQCAIKEHLDTFDDLRDTQVQLISVGKLLRQFPAARPFDSHLRKREERLTRKTRKQIKRVPTDLLGKLMMALRKDVEDHFGGCDANEATNILLRSVNRAYERTRRLRKAINPRDTTSIHRTRVAFKKFRYMVEMLGDHLPGVPEGYLEEMHHYQTMMGEIQDAEVLLAAFDKFLRKKEIKPGAANRFRSELLRRRQWLIRVYLDAADQLLDFWPLRAGRDSVARR